MESRDDRILAPFHSTIECTSARFNVDPSKFHCSHRIDHAIIIAHIDLTEDAGEAGRERKRERESLFMTRIVPTIRYKRD